MSISSGFSELSCLHRTPFQAPLAQVIAQITEVHPSSPSEGGSRQMLRINSPGGVPIDMQLFDQGKSIAMSYHGGFIRVSANPNSPKAIVWERSKACKPTQNVGVVVVRRQAHVELFTAEQATAANLNTLGFMVAAASPALGVVTTAPAAPADKPVPSPAAPAPIAPPVTAPTATAMHGQSQQDLARLFLSCLAAARAVRGPGDSDEDVRAAARATFDVMQNRLQLAA